MNIMITSYKGGVGKSSIGYNMAVYLGYKFVTNDIIANPHPDTIQIDSKKKRIPAKYCFADATIFDFGAMSTQVDPKVSHALQLSDLAIIPTTTDRRSLQAAIDTYTLLRVSGKPIAIIINHFTKERKFEEAKAILRESLGSVSIFAIRTTTLFDRVAEDGRSWLENVHNDNGEYQLNKSREKHEAVYRDILAIGEPR